MLLDGQDLLSPKSLILYDQIFVCECCMASALRKVKYTISVKNKTSLDAKMRRPVMPNNNTQFSNFDHKKKKKKIIYHWTGVFRQHN